MKLHCFLLLTSFIGVPSEERLVYRESYVLLFENVIADNPEKDVSLYINGAKQPSLIVIFKFGNGAITAEWRMDNYTKIFIDVNRNIKIANIDKTYEGKYYIQSSGRREVELTVSDRLTDEVREDRKRLEDNQEVIMKYLDRLTDEVREDRKRLEDNQEVIMKYLGNLTEKIERMTKELNNDNFGSCDSTKAILAVLIVFLVVSLPHHAAEVWKMLQDFGLWCRKHVKISKRKGMHESDQRERNNHQLHTKQPADSAHMKSTVTKHLLPGEDDTDSEAMKISVETDPDLPRGADPHSPRLPHPDMNIPGGTDPQLPKIAEPHLSKLPPADMNIPREADPHLQLLLAAHKNNSENEDDFLPTAQGKQKIDIRKT